MIDPESIKINLPLENRDGQESVAYDARAVCSPPPFRELESLNNAAVLR